MVFALGVSAFTSCETWKDDVEYSAVAPLDGRWICLMYEYNDFKAKNEAGATPVEYAELWASNTSENVAGKMWHNLILPTTPVTQNGAFYGGSRVDAISFKVESDPGNLTFSANASTSVTAPGAAYNTLVGGTVNTNPASMADWKVTITEAQVIRNGWTGASGTVADKIVYAIEFDHAINGVSKFMVVGNRYTLWQDDYKYIDDFVNNY